MKIGANRTGTVIWWICCLWLGAFADRAVAIPQFCDVTKPDFFPVIPWDPYHGWARPMIERKPGGDLKSIAECNFNVAGFVLPKDLRECRKLGLAAIVAPANPAYSNLQYIYEWRNLSDQELEKRVRGDIAAAGRNAAIMGYLINDEPGARDFPALAKAVAAVKKYAPGKMAYINLFPEYATLGARDTSQLGTSSYTEYLERFVNEVHPQFISYDNYMVEYSNDLKDRPKATVYFHNLLEVRRVAQEHHLPYVNIVSANQIVPEVTPPSPANLALQAYTTLAAGYRGVTWYTYYSQGYKYAPVDLAGNRTATWGYLQEINRKVLGLAPVMSRLESTGVFFTSPAPADGMPSLPGKVVESASCAAPLMIGEFQGNDGRSYVMVVNLSLENSAKFNLKTTQAGASFKVISPMDGSLAEFDSKAGHWLPAGQGVLLMVAK
jgi:hypothetical protein